MQLGSFAVIGSTALHYRFAGLSNSAVFAASAGFFGLVTAVAVALAERETRDAIEKAKAQLCRLKRLYKVLSKVNLATVRFRTREELLQAVCRLVVQHGAIDLAWVSRLDPNSSRIVVEVFFGSRSEALDRLCASDTSEELSNPARAIREERPFVCNECGGKPCSYPFANAPATFGFKSCGSFPLQFQGRVFGSLSLCVAEAGFFREREIELLSEVARDISHTLDKIEADAERERLGNQLRESEERFRLAMLGASEGLWDWNLKTDEQYYSPRWKSMLGYGEEELENHLETWKRLVHPDDLEPTLKKAQDLIEGGTGKFAVQFRMLHKNGSYRHILSRAFPIHDDAGEAIRLVGTHVDITEQKQAEETLRQSELKYRTLVEYIPQKIFQKDRDSVYVSCNDLFAHARGIQASDIAGKTDFDFFPRELAEKYREDDRRVMESGRNIEVEEDYIEFGNHHTVLTRKTPIRNEQGNVLGVFGIFTDITERKKALEKIEHLNRLLRSIRNVNKLIVQEKDRSRLILKACQLMVETRGCLGCWIVLTDEAELPKTHAQAGFGGEETFRPLSQELQKGVLPACCKEARFYERIYVITDREKSCGSCPIAEGHPPSDSMCIGLKREGRLFGYMTVCVPRGMGLDEEEQALLAEVAQDVAFALYNIELEEKAKHAEEERLHAEALLRQTQKMEALGTLAGGIAHDFNNILGAVMGYADMALEDAPEGSVQKRNLSHVLKAANRARELTKQILLFSRKGSPKSGHDRSGVRPGLIIKEALKLLRATLPTTIEIRKRLDASPESLALADPTQLHQVLMNLCTNAGHAMRENGGILDVALDEVDLDSGAEGLSLGLKPGLYVKLTVSDTGHGMDSAVVERIFDPFFTTKAKGEGTGMGLSVVLGIVESHGGAVGVSSSPGKGSTFEVYIPAVKQAPSSSFEKAAPVPRGKGRILLVDDEAELVEMGRQMLERLGYEVFASTSSTQAFDLFCEQPDGFDLVITDFTMPQMTGVDLASKILRMRPDLPIVLCTGYSERISKEEALGMGIRAFAMKPLVMGEMAEVVWSALHEKIDEP